MENAIVGATLPSAFGLFLLLMVARITGFVAAIVFARSVHKMDPETYFIRLVLILLVTLAPLTFLDHLVALPPLAARLIFGLVGGGMFLLGLMAGLATVYRASDAGVSRLIAVPALVPGLDVVVALVLMGLSTAQPKKPAVGRRRPKKAPMAKQTLYAASRPAPPLAMGRSARPAAQARGR